jgi:hypothetical protein
MGKWGISPSDIEDFDRLISTIYNRNYGEQYCFLCATKIHDFNLAEEHVVPKWVQTKFNLWDQRLNLPNGTSIAYRQLTVPCCYECNHQRLQPIETALSSALTKGANEIISLGEETIFLWLGKILYGLIYKDLFLRVNLRDENSGTVADQETIKSLESHLYFLQMARRKVEFGNFFPASIFIFETQESHIPEANWDFFDNMLSLFIACRLGPVGIIAVLQDGGAQKKMESDLKKLAPYPLHPIQFRELGSMVFYKSTLFNRIPKYVSISTSPITVYQLPLGGFSNKPLFDDWDYKEYAKILSYYTGVPLKYISPSADLIKTWLQDDNGQPLFMDINKIRV